MPSIRDGGEQLYGYYFLIRCFYVNDTYRQVLMKIKLSDEPSGRSYIIIMLKEKVSRLDQGPNPGLQLYALAL